MDITLDLVLEMIDNMKHTIGLDYKSPRRGRYEAYRNSFAGKDKGLDLAVQWGLAEMRMYDTHEVYRLTEAGLSFMEKIIGAEIVYIEGR